LIKSSSIYKHWNSLQVRDDDDMTRKTLQTNCRYCSVLQSSTAQGLDNVGKQYVRGEGREFRKRMEIVDTDSFSLN
jgi:hypothetical protein